MTLINGIRGFWKPFVKVADELVDGFLDIVEHAAKKSQRQWMAIDKVAQPHCSDIVDVIHALRGPLLEDLGAVMWI